MNINSLEESVKAALEHDNFDSFSTKIVSKNKILIEFHKPKKYTKPIIQYNRDTDCMYIDALNSDPSTKFEIEQVGGYTEVRVDGDTVLFLDVKAKDLSLSKGIIETFDTIEDVILLVSKIESHTYMMATIKQTEK